MKTYTPPVLVAYGDAVQITADSRDSAADDTFFRRTGQPVQGLGGSLDTCVTADDANCLG